MAEKTGGRAGKAGDSYEALWVADQALLVAEGRTHRSVLWEALGDDEPGVDLWVERTDGTREAHQCKRENGSKGRWSAAELIAKGVLTAAKEHLSRDPRHQYVFVSADAAPYLSELTTRTRSCNNNPRLFIAHQVDTEERKKVFGEVCQSWKLDPTSDHDIGQAFNWLQRMHFLRFDMEAQSRAVVERHANQRFQGKPSHILSALDRFLESNFGNTLYADSIQTHMRSEGFAPRELAGDPTLPKSVARLQWQFNESLSNLLIDGAVLPRLETPKLLEMIQDEDGPRLIFVHGNAGTGKSGVLYELTQCLQNLGVPYLPIRLDRRPPRRDPECFGREECGLPASPAWSLDALAGQRPSVLVLDQLDAVRWSSAHTRDAWDACKELIEEALCIPRMRLMVACRTFDLRDDREIRRWQQHRQGLTQLPTKVAECVIGKLPDDKVKEVLTRRGVAFDELTERQKSLLRTPQGLYLWCEVRTEATANAEFSTQTDLIRDFWRDRWERMALMGVSIEPARAALNDVVAHMDKNGTLCAPSLFFDGPRHHAATAFRSLNVFDPNTKSITFAHQSYVDYLVASRIQLESTRAKMAPLEWLRSHDQSLFRRDQLRQLLTILRDDDRQVYLRTIRGILLNNDIRFHLQHLVLRLLGTWNSPLKGEMNLIISLYNQPEWHNHVVREIICVNKSWFSALRSRGIFQAQLSSTDGTQIDAALRVMSWVSATWGDAVDRLLEPHWNAPDPWPARIRFVLPFSAANDTKKMFEFRLAQIQAGAEFQGSHLFSEGWAKTAPARCLRMLQALVKVQFSRFKLALEHPRPNELPKWSFSDHGRERALETACKGAAITAWNRLFPCVKLLGRLHRLGRRNGPLAWWGSALYREMASASTFLRKLLTVAGSELAKTSPNKFARLATPHLSSRSITIQRILLTSFTVGEHPLANQALTWLCDRPKLFHAGSRHDSSRWEPACRLIQQLSPLCSDEVYRRLEATILQYHDPRETDSIRQRLDRAKKGSFSSEVNYFGRAQNALLFALSSSRMSPNARAMARVWLGKFGPPNFAKRKTARFRQVVSPIPHDKIHLISDRQWLETAQRQWPERHWFGRDMGNDLVGEASAETFATDFAEMAKRQPRRFAALALRLPSNVAPAYLGRALWNFATSVPPEPASPDAGKWEAVTQDQFSALLTSIGYSSDYGQATGFCDVIERRCTADWSDTILENLALYATEHPDPILSNCGNELESTEINCVRGRAARAIAALIFEQPTLTARLLPAIERLTRDPHSAVRLAAISACSPILNVDRDLALKLFMQACDSKDDRVLAGHSVHNFIRYARRTHRGALIPLFERMVRSPHDPTAEAGASWAAVTWLEADTMSDEVNICRAGSIAQRKGLAKAAIGFAQGKRTRERCFELLLCLFDDESKDVRQEARAIFRHHKVYQVRGFRSFATAHLNSRAFLDEPWSVVRGLVAYRGRLKRFSKVIFEICKVVSTNWPHGPAFLSGRGDLAIGDLSDILLRLYEQSENAEDRRIRKLCLDSWDLMLRNGLGSTHRQLALLDS